MKIIDAEQGSLAWIDARLGKPTASRAADFAARTKAGFPTAARAKYAYELVAERLVGPKPQVTTAAMQRGIDQSRRRSGSTRCAPAPGGAGGLRDAGSRPLGREPDGLVGDDGLIEVKTSAPHMCSSRIASKRSDVAPARFVDQIVMLLLVTEREWCDLVQYCEPLGACRIIRVEPRAEDALREMEARADGCSPARWIRWKPGPWSCWTSGRSCRTWTRRRGSDASADSAPALGVADRRRPQALRNPLEGTAAGADRSAYRHPCRLAMDARRERSGLATYFTAPTSTAPVGDATRSCRRSAPWYAWCGW